MDEVFKALAKLGDIGKSKSLRFSEMKEGGNEKLVK